MQKLSFTTKIMLFLFVILSLALIAFFFRADVFPPKLKRVTLGSHFRVPTSLRRNTKHRECARYRGNRDN